MGEFVGMFEQGNSFLDEPSGYVIENKGVL
jgi:hypothetical protein